MSHATKEQLETALSNTQRRLADAQWDRQNAQAEAKKADAAYEGARARVEVLETALREARLMLHSGTCAECAAHAAKIEAVLDGQARQAGLSKPEIQPGPTRASGNSMTVETAVTATRKVE